MDSSSENASASSHKPRTKKTNFPADRVVIVMLNGVWIEIKITDLEKFFRGKLEMKDLLDVADQHKVLDLQGIKLPDKKCLHVSDLHNVLDLLSVEMQSMLAIDIILSYVGSREMIKSAMDEAQKIMKQTQAQFLIFCGYKQKFPEISKTVPSTEELAKIVGKISTKNPSLTPGSKGQILQTIASINSQSVSFIDDDPSNAAGVMLIKPKTQKGNPPPTVNVTYVHQPEKQSVEKSCEDIVAHFTKYGALYSLDEHATSAQATSAQATSTQVLESDTKE
jgi:hypothetical protein